MNAVRSIETRGTISTSCSDATSSSSGGVIDVLRDGGSAIVLYLSMCYVIDRLGMHCNGREWTRRGGAGARDATQGETRYWRLARSRGMTRVVVCHGWVCDLRSGLTLVSPPPSSVHSVSLHLFSATVNYLFTR